MKRESALVLAGAVACIGLAVLTFEWRDGLMKKTEAAAVNMADFRFVTVRAEERTVAETKPLKQADFEEEDTHELETVEEEGAGEDLAGTGTSEALQETPGREADPKAETSESPNPVAEEDREDGDIVLPAGESFPVYAVAGHVLDEELQRYLYQRLTEKGIAHWMPIAVCQAYQESSFDQYQVTAGKDYGLYQYRLIYWDEWCDRAGVGRGDVFDARRQIDVYTEMVAKWIAEGRSESEVISAHNDGGWARNIVPGYLNEVSRWFEHCVRIK